MALRKRKRDSIPFRTLAHEVLVNVVVPPCRVSADNGPAPPMEATPEGETKAMVAAATKTLLQGSEEEQKVSTALYVKFVHGNPHKVHILGDLLVCIARNNADLATSMLRACETQMKQSIQLNDWTGAKQFIRLFGYLSKEGLIPATGLLGELVQQLEIHLEGASYLNARGDGIVYLILSVLPWFDKKQDVDVFAMVDRYFLGRQKTQALLPRRDIAVQQYNFVQTSVQESFFAGGAKDEPDYLDSLFLSMRDYWLDAHQQNFFRKKCEGVHIDITVQLDGVAQHTAWTIYPTLPSNLQLFDIISDKPAADGFPKKERRTVDMPAEFEEVHTLMFTQRDSLVYVQREVWRETTLDLLHCYHSDVKLLGACLSDLPKGQINTGGMHLIGSVQASFVVETIFASLMTVPTPPLPLAFYAALLQYLMMGHSPYAQCVIEIFEALLEDLVMLDPSLAHRLLFLFGAHLSNHNFKWLWELMREKDKLADKKSAGCRMLFNHELSYHLLRYSPKAYLCSQVPVINRSKAWEESPPLLGYKFKEEGVPFKKEADGLLRKLRAEEGFTAEQATALVAGISGAEPRDRAEVLTHCVLLLGSDAMGHEMHLLRQYASTYGDTNADGEHVITAADEFWDAEPHRLVGTVAVLLQTYIVTPHDVVKWALTKPDKEYDYVWEIVYNSLDKLAEGVWRQTEKVVDWEGVIADLASANGTEETKQAAREKVRKLIRKAENSIASSKAELRASLKTLFEGLVKFVKKHYKREKREIRASLQQGDMTRRTAVRNFLWSRAALGRFNATGLRYLPFLLVSVDSLYEDVLIQLRAPAVMHNIYLSWRLARGRHVSFVKGAVLMEAALDPLQHEVLRRIVTIGPNGEDVTETLFDRIDVGKLDPSKHTLQQVSNEGPPSSDEEASDEEEEEEEEEMSE